MQKSSASSPGRSATRSSQGDTSPLRPGFGGKWMAWIVLVVSLFITFFAWHLAMRLTMEKARDRFVFQVEAIESALRERLRACEFLLQSGAGLFAVSGEVTRVKWRTYVTGLQVNKYYQGVQGLGFSKRILESAKKAHIRQMRQAGFPGYNIHPGGERPEYTAIIFLEPFDWRNQRAFGYDMFSEPTRRQAMERARDTGLAAVSGKVTLLQETDTDVQAGFLMYLPVYRNGEVPGTLKQRREALTGYVYSPFRMTDFMRGLPYEQRGYVDLQIFDGNEPLNAALLYHSGDSRSRLFRPDRKFLFTHQNSLEYAGHRWLLVSTSTPYFEDNIHTGPVNALLVFGIVISLLLFAVVLFLIKSRNQALSLANISLDLERANRGLKKEIGEREKAMAALRGSEAKFRNLFNSAEVGMFRTRLDGSEILDMNEKILDILGYTREEVQGSPSVIRWADPGEREEIVRRIELEGRVPNFECGMLNKQGEVRTCLVSLVLYRGQGLLEGSLMDITGRKQMEVKLQEQEHLLSESQRLGHIGSFLTDFTGPIQWSDELYRLYGVSPDTFTPTIACFLGLIHPDDRKSMQDWIAACAAGKNPDALDFRINRPDGTMRYFKGWGEVVQESKTRPLYMAGTVQDITESKRADEKNQQYVAELAQKNKDLQDALADIRQLTGMLPICASCKKIRNDSGYWSEVESYISEHTDAVFTSGLCPVCEKKAYADLDKLINGKT